MTEGNNEYKGFVRSEIKNIKDAAKRNYDEHVTMYGILTEIKVALAVIEEKLASGAATKRAKYAMLGTLGGAAMAVIFATVALLRSFL